MEKPLPNATDVERTLIGEILIYGGEVMERLAGVLRPEHFYSARFSTIYRAALSLYGSGSVVDISTVTNWLQTNGKLEEVGGIATLAECARLAVSGAHAEAHAEILLEKWRKRQLVTMSHQVLKDAMSDKPLEDVEKTFSQWLDILNADSASGSRFISAEDFPEIWEKVESGEDISIGLKTPWKGLNDLLLYGFSRGTLSIVAGRPKMGKTTLKYNLIRHWLESGASVFSWSPEMGVNREVIMLLALHLGASFEDLLTGRIDRRLVSEAFDYMREKWKLFISGDRGIGLVELFSMVRAVKRKHDIDIVVLDMFDRLREVGSVVESKAAAIKQVLERLYSFAGQERVHVMAVWQLNRALEGRKDHRPRLSDLAESGAAEQIADLVLMLHRENYFDEMADPTEMEVIVRAQRGSGAKTGTAVLHLQGDIELVEYGEKKPTTDLPDVGDNDLSVEDLF